MKPFDIKIEGFFIILKFWSFFNVNINMENRICKKCQIKKPLADYPLLKQGTYRSINCNICYLAFFKDRRMKNIKQYYKIAQDYRNKLNQMEERSCSLCNINKKKEKFPSGQVNCRQCMAYRAACRKDKKRGFNTCTLEEWNIILITGICTYCKFEEEITADRIDNSKGHEATNILPACNICNRMRSIYYTVQEMTDIIGPAIRQAKLNRLNNPM